MKGREKRRKTRRKMEKERKEGFLMAE